MQVPGEAGLYVLGCFERRVTLLSQQVRALNLVYALCETGRLLEGSKLLVVGGGAAGMTVAAAAARRGCKVTLLEKAPMLLPLFRSCHSRWLHPQIYDWPEEDPRLRGREPGEARLPLLSWKAAMADDVARQLEREWDTLPERSNITVHCGAVPASLGTAGETRHVTWNGREGLGGGRFAAVVLAVGFGLERQVEGLEWVSYWGSDRLDKMLGGRKRHLISGCGDGGLVDLLRVWLKDFRHDKLEEEFLAGSSLDAVKKELHAIEKEALQAEAQKGSASASRELLFERYQSLELPPEFDRKIETRLRPDTEAWLNGREGLPLSLNASILNRFLVSRLLFKFGVHYEAGEFTHEKVGRQYKVRFPSGVEEFFDHVTCRHGPSPTALETNFQNILGKCGPLKARSALDQTRWPVWKRGYFGPEAEPKSEPVPNKPTSERVERSKVSAVRFIGVSAESLGKGFKGREAILKRLHEQLGGGEVVLTGGQSGRVFAHGGGGIGKSRLAIEYAYRYQDAYPGGIFFAVAKKQPPMALWARFARELFPAEPLARDEDAALRFVRWLAEREPGRRLIIFDDVQAAEVAELYELFPGRLPPGPHPFWPPPSGQVSLLVTTRLREFPKALSLEVEQLDDSAALDLLLERAQRTGVSGTEREVAQEIAATLLGGHPLALSLAGSYVRRLGLSFSEYKKALRQKGLTDRLLEAAKQVGHTVEDHERSIVATYELSRRQLDLKKADDALAWRLLRMCAFLAPNVPIDRELLAHLLEQKERGRTAEELGRALARLLDELSLLDPVREEHGQVGAVKIHPLVSDYTRWSMTDAREREGLLSGLVDAMVQLFPNNPEENPNWGRLSPSRESQATELWKAANAVETRERWILGMQLGDLHVARGALWRAHEAYQAGLDFTQRRAQQDPGNAGWQRDVSVSLLKLGDVLVEEGALAEARQAFERDLAIAEELAKKDPGNARWQTDVVVSCSKVASVLMKMAPPETSRARLLLERAEGILLTLKASSRLTPTQQNNWIHAIELQLRQLDELPKE